MLLLDLFESPHLSKTEKLWVNGPEKKIIVVPTEYHHTQFVYMKPPKFGLSGKLFAGHTYPMNTSSMGKMEPMPYDQIVGKEMFDRGWVRVNADNNKIDSLHGNNLKIIAQALGHLKRNNYSTNSIVIAVGNDIDADAEYVINDSKEIRLFMRSGVIPRRRINENAFSGWRTWWLNPQVDDQFIPLSGLRDQENSHWLYVKEHYEDMVADRRGAREILTNYDIFEDNVAFKRLIRIVFNSGWVRVGQPHKTSPIYVTGSNDKSIWLAAKRIMKELNYPSVSVDINNIDTASFETLEDDMLYKYLKTGRIPRQRVVAEGVGENLLYHGTLLYKATRILQDKALTKGRISHRVMRINPRDLKASKRDELSFSMSRDPNLNFADLGKGNAEIIFVFRKDVLTNTFAMAPFDFAGSASTSHGAKMPAMPAGGVNPREESEEIIYGTRIPVNNRTVAKIIIRPLGYGDDGRGEGTGGDLNLLRQLAKQANISVEDTQ